MDARIRNRMASDCRDHARTLRSELNNYREEFWPGELQALKHLVRDLEALAERIDKNDRLERAKDIRSKAG